MNDLVVDMSQKRETKCRFCGGRSLLFPVTGGDYSYFECDNCGKYRVSGTAEWVIERGGASPARLMEVPAWLEAERRRGVEVPMVLANRIEAGKTLPPRIEHLCIRGFRSLADVTLSPAPGANLLIGANGSGKSNIIHFFNMLSWMLKSRRLAEFVSRHGGADDQLHGGSGTTSHLDAEIRIRASSGRNDYRFSLVPAHTDELLFTEESFRYSRDDLDTEAPWNHLGVGHREALIVEAGQARDDGRAPTANRQQARIVTHLLRNCTAYQFHNTGSGSNFKKTCDATDHAFLRADGGNLAAILHWLENEDVRRYELICRHIQRVLPGFDRFEIDEKYGKVGLRWQSRHFDKTFGAQLTSDGSLRFFALATLLNLPGEMLPGVVLLDEPELGLHPKAISLVGDMIRALAESRQVIVATQSPLLLDAFELDQVFVLEARDGRTEVRSPDREALRDWLEEFTVGEIWQKNLLGGRP